MARVYFVQDVAWNHDQCSADIVKALFKNGSVST